MHRSGDGFLRICWRDLWRNRRRTVLTALVMTFAEAVMILYVGLGDGAHLAMIRSATDAFLGHVQVQPEGYRDEPDLVRHISAHELAVLDGTLGGVADVDAWAPRAQAGGLISKAVAEPAGGDDPEAERSTSSEGAFVVGVRPAAERRVSSLARSVVADEPGARCERGCRAGRAEVGGAGDACAARCRVAAGGFDGAACREAARSMCADACPAPDETCEPADCRARFEDYCEPARFLALVDPAPDQLYRGEIVLGAGLAKVLEAGVGDRVAVTTGTARGRTFASLYRVVGLVKTGSLDINRTFALTHLDKLAKGLDLEGGASTVVVSVRDLDRAGAIAAEVDRRLRGPLPGLVAFGWAQLSPELDLFVKIDQGSLLIMLLLLVMVVGVIVANVVTMSVMERTREYGVRLALGESPDRIGWGLVTETVMLALVACALGSVAGEASNLYFQTHGIDFGLGDLQTTGVVVSSVFTTEVTLYGWVFSVGTVLAFSVLGALWPAWRIRRLRPVQALRFV